MDENPTPEPDPTPDHTPSATPDDPALPTGVILGDAPFLGAGAGGRAPRRRHDR